MNENPQVLILVGSKSDVAEAEKASKILKNFGVPFELMVLSAHRAPEEVAKIVKEKTSSSVKVVIAGAGLAAHLAGAVASRTIRPVIGVPIAKTPLMGFDSLLSTVQMPAGIPVATVGIGAFENSALLAIEILAINDPDLSKKLEEYRQKIKEEILQG